eukprot:524968-Hanusia_phi.AAC.1
MQISAGEPFGDVDFFEIGNRGSPHNVLASGVVSRQSSTSEQLGGVEMMVEMMIARNHLMTVK